MDDFGCIDELNCDFNNLSDSINNLNDTLGMNNCVNNAYDAGQYDGVKNGLQGFGLIARQYQALIILLIILYWWTTQYTATYFMNSNSQLINNVSCVLDKLVDNAVETTSKCCPTAGESEKKRCKHRKHRCKCCDCCCDSGCDCDSECCC